MTRVNLLTRSGSYQYDPAGDMTQLMDGKSKAIKVWEADKYFYRLPLVSPLRGEIVLDLGAECAGDFFERRQRHAIVSSPLRTRDVGLLHTDPPREFGLGPAVFQPGSDQNLRENLALGSPHYWRTAARTSSLTLSWPPNRSLDKPADHHRISTSWLWMFKVYGTRWCREV